MKIKLSLVAPSGQATPVLVTADGTADIGRVAAALHAGATQVPVPDDQALTLQALDDEGREVAVLPARATLLDSVLFSGQRVRVVMGQSQHGVGSTGSSAPARLRVLSCPDPAQAGKSFPLRTGPNLIGRDPECDVTLNDHKASRRHARVIVGDRIEIADMNSSNGVIVGDTMVDHATLGPFDTVLIGETRVQVERNPELRDEGAVPEAQVEISQAFNRSPLVRRAYEGREFAAPKPPSPAKPGRLPLVAMVAPLVMGAVLFAFTHRVLSIVFVALSPLIALGTWIDRRYTNTKEAKVAAVRFTDEVGKLSTRLGDALDEEHLARCAEVPSLDALVDAAFRRSPDLWYRRPENDDFLTVNLGYGRTASRHTLVLPDRGDAADENWEALAELKRQCADVEDVPIVAGLRQCGNLGLAGPRAWLDPVAGNIVAQIVCLHSPAEVTLAAVASAESCGRWDWLMWLPHVGSAHSPVPGVAHLAASPGGVSSLVSSLEELVAARRASRSAALGPITPAVVVVVEDDAPVERGRLVGLAEQGADVGVHLLWLAERQERLPAACHAYLVPDGTGRTATAGFVKEHRADTVTRVEGLAPAVAELLGRRLSPVLDAGAPVIDQSDIPRSVSYLALAGTTLASDPAATVERWQEDGSLRPHPPLGGKSAATLRGLIGQGAHGAFLLDLRTQGPHALVGGTTGAGKSEFLQSWILGMAAAHSPYRVTFLFVDYKGGAAFADCVRLPHTVGLVTDLSQHLVRRALTSLRAELRYREHLLNAKKAKDLIALERTGDPDCPPSLIIVVDEFAALVQEVPEFVDGVVDVAQRGRSLGLHLILATQRPAGVIKDNLRANTNLRIALRMADEGDSADVIGTSLAAEFDPRIPGRGAVRTGPGRIALFQAGYAGGRTSATPEPPRIEIETMTFGQPVPWEIPTMPRPVEDDEGPTDIARAVAMIKAAADHCAIPEPRKPWLPELEACYNLEDIEQRALAELPAVRPPGGQRLVIGLADDPDAQAQRPVVHDPDAHGNLAVFGTSGAGKSALLRTLAVSAGLQADQSRTEVYGLDFGSSGLAMLEPLPHVGAVIDGADHERLARLLRRLIATLDERAPRYAAARAGSIAEYRQATGQTHEPRILLLIDGFAAFREAYETTVGRLQYYTMAARLLSEGRAVGIHVIVSAERPSGIPASVGANIQRRLVLRQAEEAGYLTLSVAKDILGPGSPPGRSVFSETDNEIQVAVPGGSSAPAAQAAAIDRLAERMTAAGVPAAEPVERLTTYVTLGQLPEAVDGRPVLGVCDDTLAPMGFTPQGAFVVAGQQGSGRSTALRALALSLHRWQPDIPLFYCGPRRSLLHTEGFWTAVALDPDAQKELAAELKPRVEQAAAALPGVIVFLEAVNEIVGTPSEQALAEIIKLGKRNNHLIVGEAETTSWGTSWPVVSEIRSQRRGVVLQPDYTDGEALFRVAFPRMKRTDHPLGRAVYVDTGKFWTVQLPMPE